MNCLIQIVTQPILFLGKLWSIIVILSQVLPFLYMAYIFFALCSTLMPMMGRFGTNLNPDLLVGGLCALGTILAMGFVVSRIYINIFIASLHYAEYLCFSHQWLICSVTLRLFFWLCWAQHLYFQ